jgi:hypothetical protein
MTCLNIEHDGFFIDAPFSKLAVFLFCFVSFPAELPEDPIRGEARVGLFFACGGAVAAPFPVFGLFDHLRANRIQNHITADLQKMRVLLNEDGLVPALEKVSGLVAAFVPRLGINTI